MEDLDRLLSEMAVRRLAYQYARGGDRIDAGLFTLVFWPGGGYRQQGNDEPMSQIADSLLNEFMAGTFSCTHHLVGNILVDFSSQDTAKAEVYFTAFHLTQPDLGEEAVAAILGPTRMAKEPFEAGQSYEIVVGGRYLDELERHDGVWKIHKRRMVLDYTTARRNSGLEPGEGLYLFSEARMARDESDPSYS